MIGERTAEEIKMTIGNAMVSDDMEQDFEIRGRDLVSGLPKTLTIHADEITEALKDPVRKIVDVVKMTLERTPPELAADILDRGIMLTGGGALLHNLDKVLSQETGIPVIIAEDP